MILDRLENVGACSHLAGPFADAVAFLNDSDLAALPLGCHEIGVHGVYATAVRQPLRHAAEGRLEAHLRYADIQVLLGGGEAIGWRPVADCFHPSGAYDPETDLRFFTDEPQTWIRLRPGQFGLFLPADAHLPLVGEGLVHKIVVKVPLDGR